MVAAAVLLMVVAAVKHSISFELYLNVNVVVATISVNFISFCRNKR